MDLAEATVRRLVNLAHEARAAAYAPYSNFPVGAAVLGLDGAVYAGCNVENSSFGLTVCAERHAVAAAVLAGTRPIAVAVSALRELTPPCGACRQVLAEFEPDMPVILTGEEGRVRIERLDAILPGSFRLE